MKLARAKLISIGRRELPRGAGIEGLFVFITQVERRPVDWLIGQTGADRRDNLIGAVAAGVAVTARRHRIGLGIRKRVGVIGIDERDPATHVESPLIVEFQVVLRIEGDLGILVVNRPGT